MNIVNNPVLAYTRKLNTMNTDVNVNYPFITGDINPMASYKINSAITALLKSIIKEQVGSSPSEEYTMSGWYELKTNQRGVLSLALGNYTFPIPSAHGMTILKSLTFSIKNGKSYTLGEMFKDDSNYVQVLSDIIKQQIDKRDINLLNDFESISPDQDYYIADKCIVIYFQLYEITPYAYGFPFFPISIYEIEDIIKDDSPLGKMFGAF